MALKVPPSPLVITLTQGGADAFVQGSVSTGLQSPQAYRLAGIAFGFSNAGLLAIASAQLWNLMLTVTRRTKAALPEVTDNDVIKRFSLFSNFVTSGATVFEGDFYWKPDFEIPLVEDEIYAQLDSDGIGAAVTMNVRLDVEVDRISDIDRLTILTRSLA